MRYLSALALMLVCLAFPVHAQRGGAHGGGGGFGGGFHGGGGGFGGGFRGGASSFGPHAAPASAGPRGFGSPGYRTGLPSAARPGFYSAPRMAAGTGMRGPYGSRTAGRGYPPAVSAGRANFYNRNSNGVVARTGIGRNPYGYGYGGRYGYGYGGRYGYGYPRFFSPRFGYPSYLSFGFFDPFFWGYDPFWESGDWMGYESAPYGSQAWVDPQAQYGGTNGYAYPGQSYQGQPYQGQASPAPANQGQANPGPLPPASPGDDQPDGPWAPQSWTGGAPPTVAAQERAVTLVFKDGRPPVRIRNYAMTRTVLFTGTDMREIPLDEIDVPATQKLNRASGVDFRLP